MSGRVRVQAGRCHTRSDHKALLIELEGIPTIAAHRPCLLSSSVKFKKQRTLESMFRPQKRKKEIDSGSCSKESKKDSEGSQA